MRKVPEIRFDGFDGEWEEVQLGIEADVRDGTHDSPKYVNKGYPLITSKNIVNGKLNFDDISFISEEDFYLINKRSKVDIGDIIMPMIGTIGNPIILNRDDFAIKNVALIKKSNNLDNQFLLNLLNSKVFSRYLYRENAGGTQKFIALGMIREFLFNRPTIEEQEKIGDLFRKIDALIEIQEGKVSKMEDFKKSMLQKIFPKKGELVPDFRFDGFDGEWKKLKFRDIYKTYESGNRLPKSLLKEGSIPYVLAKTTNNGIHMRIDKDTLDYNGNTMKLFNPNSITFSIDNPEAVFIQNEPFYTSNIMRVFYNENHTITQTIFYKLQFEKNTRGFDWGIKFSGPVALDSKLFVPFKNNEIDVTEIDKIGQFFKNIDTQIENEEKLLESYKMMKKSLLQKMFV